jgi:CheY-like chemotaxis protein
MDPVKNKILVVEDDEIIRKVIVWRLNRLGYTICGESSTGQDAIRLAEELNPDAIVMDYLLEGNMDGIEAARVIRKDRDVPFIFLTAHSDKKLLEKIIPLKPAQYILKPFSDNDLWIALGFSLGW